MKTSTVTAFRANMKGLLAEVESEQDILILSGPKKKNFVLLTLQQFNVMQETAHLLSTPANTAHLMESITQHKSGNVLVKDFSLDTREEMKGIRRTLRKPRVKKNTHSRNRK